MGKVHMVTVFVIAASFSLFINQSAVANDNMCRTSNADWDCWDGIMSNGLFCQTGNTTRTYYEQSSLTGNAVPQVDATMFNSYDGTDLNVSYAWNPSYSGSAETDIIYQVSTTGLPEM